MDEKRVVFKEGLVGFEQDGTPYLIASRCKSCGRVFFPNRDFCTECYSTDMEDVKLKDAQIHVFSVVYIGVKGFPTPYILAWVTFEEGVRIVAQLDWPAEEANKLHVGQNLKVTYGVLRVLEDGTQVCGYKFRPVFD